MKTLKIGSKWVKNDEYYTNPETVAKMFDILQPKRFSTLMLPFDTANSNFYKYAKTNDFETIYNVNDWLENDYEYDYLITNPPYTLKDKVIEKCYLSKKPSILVLPIDVIGGVKRHGLYKKFGYPTFYIPTKRINYISKNGIQTKSNHFHSLFLYINDPLGSRLLWE